MSTGKLAIVGVGEVPTGRYPERSRWDIIYKVCMQAVKDAGIDKNDVEGVISVAPQAQPRLISEVAFGKIPECYGIVLHLLVDNSDFNQSFGYSPCCVIFTVHLQDLLVILQCNCMVMLYIPKVSPNG